MQFEILKNTGIDLYRRFWPLQNVHLHTFYKNYVFLLYEKTTEVFDLLLKFLKFNAVVQYQMLQVVNDWQISVHYNTLYSPIFELQY